jgi:8-oxo-dGTP diphosphatase
VTVRAAGGVLVRDGAVLLVHRPRYDDWSFPKGKRDKGETDEQCAVREVEEETGFRCKLGAELLPTVYIDAKRRPKTARYWVMTPVGEVPFVPNDEVDELRWVPINKAENLLSYARDVDVWQSWRDRCP